MRKVVPAIGLAALLAGSAAGAQDVVALTPAAREQALEAGATQAAIDGAPGFRDGRVHGEVGVAVGSNGMRAAYGTAVIPLGDTGSVVVSYYNEQYGRPRAR